MKSENPSVKSNLEKFLKLLHESYSNCFWYSVFYFQKPMNILHCGAHLGEEYPVYKSAGAQNIFWLEANPNLYTPLTANFGADFVFPFALSSQSNQKIPFYLTGNILSSSTKKINSENQWGVLPSSVIEVESISLRDLLAKTQDSIDLLVLDLQGGELDALNGPDLLQFPKFIIVEVSDTPFYLEGCSFIDVKEKLQSLGYRMIKVEKSGVHGHGEALFIFKPNFREKIRQLIGCSVTMCVAYAKKTKHLATRFSR